MDKVNHEILDILQVDGRISMTELGKRVNLSTPAVTERVRKLEEQGVIVGYKAQVNPDKIGKSVKAFILVETHRCKPFREFCRKNPLVIECHRLTGQYSYLVKIITDDYESLESFIDSTMDYGQPYTMINLSSPVPTKIL
jgi:DNA-binding Lrp family transcriptional regulator